MLKIRFQRTGRRNDPSFRIVVGEHTTHPKSGKQADTVGSYNPKTKETILKEEAIKEWLAKGAKASGTVHNLLISKGVIEGKKVNVLPKKKPIVKEEEPKEGTPKAEESPKEADTNEEAPTEEEAKVEDAPKEEPTPEEPKRKKRRKINLIL